MLHNLQETIRHDRKRLRVVPFRKWRPYAAAAITLIIAGAIYYLSPSASEKVEKQLVQQNVDVALGKSKAILTLANGKRIEIDGAANGTIAEQDGVNVVKQDGTITYSGDELNTGTSTYNIMSTSAEAPTS